MGLGKMTGFAEIILPVIVKDSNGFVTENDEILASIRVYKEFRHGSVRWANLASFSTASVLFRFRKIPDLEITTKHIIVCETGRYRVLSVEDIKNRKMYLEVLAEEVKPSGEV
ncbi:MAG: head-tail adaptor protein [Oscillospiraceae bacterium]|jgi:hypothetical protein|nr:head-tail adaptor protein [Oscillospiraceae bacterium]